MQGAKLKKIETKMKRGSHWILYDNEKYWNWKSKKILNVHSNILRNVKITCLPYDNELIMLYVL